jgi:hypothetical protein
MQEACLRCLGFLCRQEAIGCLDYCDLDPKAPEDLSQLTTDRTPAEDNQRFRLIFDLRHIMRGPIVDFSQAWNGRDGRLRAGCDHNANARRKALFSSGLRLTGMLFVFSKNP